MNFGFLDGAYGAESVGGLTLEGVLDLDAHYGPSLGKDLVLEAGVSTYQAGEAPHAASRHPKDKALGHKSSGIREIPGPSPECSPSPVLPAVEQGWPADGGLEPQPLKTVLIDWSSDSDSQPSPVRYDRSTSLSSLPSSTSTATVVVSPVQHPASDGAWPSSEPRVEEIVDEQGSEGVETRTRAQTTDGVVKTVSKSRSRLGRNVDKVKHKQSEHRRRERLRERFDQLHAITGCKKKDRATILNSAMNQIAIAEREVMRLRQEREQLARLVHSRESRRQHCAGLAAYPALQFMACSFIALDGRFMDCNSPFLSFLRYRHDQLVGTDKTMFSLTHQDSLSDTFCMVQKLTSGKLESTEFEKKCVSRIGETRLCHVMASIATDGGRVNGKAVGQPSHYVIFMVPKDLPRPPVVPPVHRNAGYQHASVQ